MDPNAFNAALNAPAGSPEQIQVLSELRAVLEQQQATIPIFLTTLSGRVLAQPGESIVKQWMLDLLLFGLTQSQLAVDNRAQSKSRHVWLGVADGVRFGSCFFNTRCSAELAERACDGVSQGRDSVSCRIISSALPSTVRRLEFSLVVQTNSIIELKLQQPFCSTTMGYSFRSQIPSTRAPR
jgi:hypothetical protein